MINLMEECAAFSNLLADNGIPFVLLVDDPDSDLRGAFGHGSLHVRVGMCEVYKNEAMLGVYTSIDPEDGYED